MHRFWDIRLLSIQWPWNPGLGSLKVIENYPIVSGTHDFLLMFHSNHRPMSHRFRDKRRCTSEIARKSPIFPPPVYLTPPLKGFPLEFCIGAWVSKKTRVIGLSDGRKGFRIGLAVLIQYRSVTDTQPRCHSYYALCCRAERKNNILLQCCCCCACRGKKSARNFFRILFPSRNNVKRYTSLIFQNC